MAIGCMDEYFTVYLPLFTVCFPPYGFGFMPPVERTLSIKVILNSRHALLSQWLLSFFCSPSVELWKAAQQLDKHNPTRPHAIIRNNSPLLSLPLQPHSWRRSCMTICTSESIKRKHIFFPPGLSLACLTRAVCRYLPTPTFIPTRCDTAPSLPPPWWFRSCPLLSGFYPKASVEARIILRVVINCISYFLLYHLRRASCGNCDCCKHQKSCVFAKPVCCSL